MKLTEDVKRRWLDRLGLAESDPEFSEIIYHFALGEVPTESRLDGKTRYLAILSALMGCRSTELFAETARSALNEDVTPAELKELVYQGTAYLGLGTALSFLRALNEVLSELGVAMPLPPQGRVTCDERTEAGNEAQVEIFGEHMRGFQNSGAEETRHINRWLAANCFGDYYTRGALDLRQRELITFCLLAAQGGCEPQLVSHAAGNMRLGNDRLLLIDAVSQCLPYMGYPRSLNALRCVDEAAK